MTADTEIMSKENETDRQRQRDTGAGGGGGGGVQFTQTFLAFFSHFP